MALLMNRLHEPYGTTSKHEQSILVLKVCRKELVKINVKNPKKNRLCHKCRLAPT